MNTNTDMSHAVAVIGAGPAGIYASKILAEAGHQVALINRDIKPGGLSEYGIYPDKHRMKEGLRKQFRKILEMPNVHYLGNVMVGEDERISLQALQDYGFKAILVTVGAQGTKFLNIPDYDKLKGVYHAKDLVYFYNQLPPFSEWKYPIGEKIVLIGAGNVMLDIAHWLVRDLKKKEVISVVRRGPAEVKFSKKEWKITCGNLDQDAFLEELERVKPVMEKVGQDPEEAKAFIIGSPDKCYQPVSDTKFSFRFLASPKGFRSDGSGNVTGLIVDETSLELRPDGSTRAVQTGEISMIEADTVVLCIGDRIDSRFGLPLNEWNEFATNPIPQYPVDEISYESYDENRGENIDGVFLAGWAREPSKGLVGSARKDGENGAKALLASLEKQEAGTPSIETVQELIADLINQEEPIVFKTDWKQLEKVEKIIAEEQGLEFFKFSSNEAMLKAIHRWKVK